MIGIPFTEMQLCFRQNIFVKAIKKTDPATPIFPGLMPTDGREHPRHVSGFTRLVIMILYSFDLSKSFFKKVGVI